jgi:putative DNA methylase
MPTMKPRKSSPRLIETDAFPFEFVSRLAERESWRKEIHRPIYHVHKWWAKRLGSVFRGILLGTMLPEEADFPKAFYKKHVSASKTVFDPFMGSGTTIGEAHKLGFTAIGRDINPVAVESNGSVRLPTLALEHGFNTRQAMSYGFTCWRDFFNDRQLLALGWLHAAIEQIPDAVARAALLTLFSGALEFNNMFASYKGEGTGAVRHMFSHHILKPERAPIEANVWGTPKSSGAFSNLFRSRLLRAIEYREAPTEVNGTASARGRVCAPSFSGNIDEHWPVEGKFAQRAIYLSCGDSANTGLPDGSVDLVVTDPPFFDNVHYSELADFFHAWRQLRPGPTTARSATTRSASEVQDVDADNFATKLTGVFRECHRVLKEDGLLIFTYHHSREEGWTSVAEAVLGAGFAVVNSQPVKAEMSVAAPKSQAKQPIQLDIILVCRKQAEIRMPRPSVMQATGSAKEKLKRLVAAGFQLSRNDRKIALLGQLLTTLSAPEHAARFRLLVDHEVPVIEPEVPVVKADDQLLLFDSL